MIRKTTVGCFFTIYLLLLNCNPKVVNQTNSSTIQCPRIESEKADTVSYVLSFTDQIERDAFSHSFSEFLKNYNFTKLSSDTIRHYFHIKLLPETNADHTMTITRVPEAEFSEGIIAPDSIPKPQNPPPEEIDTTIPDFGGTVKIYLPRADIIHSFSGLTSIHPFVDSSSGVLSVADSSLRKVTLKINGKIINAKNQVLSAIDLISNWTEFTKNHPAEGYALFRHVEGIKEFVSG